MTDTLALARALIERASVTPDDAGCQDLIAERLGALGFRVERLPFGEVNNLWAEIGDHGPLLVFAGHTDVVPAGDPAEWDTDPFVPSERDGYLYGRGAADMKSSLAAMVTAAERFCRRGRPAGRLGFLITSDEEGVAVDGTVRVMQTLLERGVQIDFCVVGEPSSTEVLGDVIKVGRRGSLSARLRFLGSKGHVAYPQLADNAVHGGLPALAELITLEWDQGNDHFPPTTLQISNIRAGVGAGNVIPGSMEVDFNLRFSTEIDAAGIRQRVELIAAVRKAIADETGVETRLSAAGGTSDGRFIAPTGAQVVELGPVNATIHKVNERVAIADLEPLSRIYEAVMALLLGTQ